MIKYLFSELVRTSLPHMTYNTARRNRDLLIAAGVSDKRGYPSEFAHFVGDLRGPIENDVALYHADRNFFRKLAGIKVVYEARKRFTDERPEIVEVACLVAALMCHDPLHDTHTREGYKPFGHVSSSDFVDDAIEMLLCVRLMSQVKRGAKNAALRDRRVNPDVFHNVLGYACRLLKACGKDARITVLPESQDFWHDQMLCGILAGTHWLNSFDRDDFLSNIAGSSVVAQRRHEINEPDSRVVVFGWYASMGDTYISDGIDVDRFGYPLTCMYEHQICMHAPDLLELPLVRKQLKLDVI